MSLRAYAVGNKIHEVSVAPFGDSSTRTTRATAVQAAITHAANEGIGYVYVPEDFFDYDASAVTFDTTVRMVREGGSPGVFDVVAYGAAGDGSTDDAEAISAAIDAQEATLDGAVVFPGGTFNLSSWPATTKHGLVFRGAGARRDKSGTPTVLAYTGSATNFITFADQQGLRFENFHIDMSGAADGDTVGLRLRSIQNCEFSNVHITGVSGAKGRWGFYLDTTANGSLIYNTFVNCSAINLNNTDTDGLALFMKSNDGLKAVNNNVFINFNGGGCDIGIQQAATPCNENVFLALELGSCTNGATIRGRNTVLNGNIESITNTAINIPAGSSIASVVLLGVHLENNGADFFNPDNRPVGGWVGAGSGLAMKLASIPVADRAAAGEKGRATLNDDHSILAFDDGSNWLANSIVAESANAEEPQGTYDRGTIVEFTDTGDASGDGIYILGTDGSTWTQIG